SRIATERRYEEAEGVIDELHERHLITARELMADAKVAGGYSLDWAKRSIDYQFNELKGLARSVATLGELTPRSQDAIVSFGERLSSVLVTAAFAARGVPAELVDSRQFIITDKQFTRAAPDMAETRERA